MAKKKLPVTTKRHKKPPPVVSEPTPTSPARPNPAPNPGQPIFSQPIPSPDPTGFINPVMDKSFAGLTALGEVPTPRGNAVEPVLTLAEVYGNDGSAKMQAIQQSGQIVFHSVGDTGSVIGPATQSLVADKMVTDFTEPNPADVPSFSSIWVMSFITSAKTLTITTSCLNPIALIQLQS